MSAGVADEVSSRDPAVPDRHVVAAGPAGHAVEITGLTKRFGPALALDDLTLALDPGEVLGYLGPNGSGKTTTIRLLLGLLRPSAGSARVFGTDVTHDSVRAHRQLAYVPGDVVLWDRLTGAQTLDLLAHLRGGVDVAYRDRLCGRFAVDLARRVGELSKGNRQKLALVSALASRAPLLLLDEPTSGLDPLVAQHFRDAVVEARDRGQAVLLSSHVLDEVQALADRVAILRHGRLVDVAPLERLRGLAAVHVEATLPDAPDAGPSTRELVAALTRLPGVGLLGLTGTTLRLRVAGDMNPLLARLAAAGATRLLASEPSLEELFLTYYSADGTGVDGTGADATGGDGTGTDATGAGGTGTGAAAAAPPTP